MYELGYDRYHHLFVLKMGCEGWGMGKYGSVSQRLKSPLVMQSPPTRTNLRQEIRWIGALFCEVTHPTISKPRSLKSSKTFFLLFLGSGTW